jgi:hypothetical protein
MKSETINPAHAAPLDDYVPVERDRQRLLAIGKHMAAIERRQLPT